ncbi:hypothetical protein HKX54_15220 [Sulfitobacter sp. M57]|uniref:hypothetical protein n=1 Tax=unclassified Sulfitobacter TaxID=196795 RepID=UPI0023E0C1BB|nr:MULTISPECIES: hypothetical protein [unclassified Sulfitobacter]MDF3415822.1 hypothetical protein [Sulfitobacter sp. KE5]MDF3423302.1 hypothetical protein [Sulfitobacter sp. KE43]MDF3434368.1 hypothetical protein [Sulfitobacter sp. KE42]MDF3460008.1 hypothetical protein [Sulfitobacter sp. S74]MDF3463906.1 hypothetical protein [Sulfitobacter sp. Ks18]
MDELLKERSVSELLALHAEVSGLLKSSGAVRSSNNPAGDYAETLFCKAFGWEMAGPSIKGYDARDAQGVRYQIKSRRLTETNGSRQLSALRNLQDRPFDFLAGVLFSSDYRVFKAAIVPHRLVLENTRISAHTNSRLFHLRDAVWNWPDVRDVTKTLRAVRL